ncbi:S4 domain-containing protein [Pontixanthobacter aestiaquae]|uniref:RNA-binding S4 domain-containing protein n=1 Tax=Pontixanthobacter aestiaquae TaxID=1509367 RepID=A0A844Z3M2_9SPHN|nr:S4 domain-containing protein [Pontixanthobacter aestiaquae]MDN3646914.1 S4 domain-containing protein [Pontixanthobacter aestiaquae]MXO82104.1 RNA-binding S4 domain-containing protein [Pontixanthobacter aestiaquae]
MRIDRLLCYLRFVKTRSQAHQLVDEGHIRCNWNRIERDSYAVSVGDILVLPIGNGVRIIEILSIPERRGPPALAQSCYRVLDPQG